MSILQNAYQSYLESKYENEIKEFQELAIKEISEYIEEYKDAIKLKVDNYDYSEIDVLTDLLHDYVELLELVEYSPLTLESEWLTDYKLYEVANVYSQLEEIIVEGERVKKVSTPSEKTFTTNIQFTHDIKTIDEFAKNLWKSVSLRNANR